MLVLVVQLCLLCYFVNFLYCIQAFMLTILPSSFILFVLIVDQTKAPVLMYFTFVPISKENKFKTVE